jgi:integrase
MSRRSKGPRLYLRPARPDKGQSALWVIRDGSREVSTGFAPGDVGSDEGAEQKLAAYIASKWTPDGQAVRTGDPATVFVAEVLAFYVKKKAPRLADPVSAVAWSMTLDAWWGDRTLGDVKMSTCEEYVAFRVQQPIRAAKRGAALNKRVSDQTARRELETLSAAITFWAKEHPLTTKVTVSLPLKDESQRDALTRSQAAALLKAAMGWRWVPTANSGADLGAHLPDGKWKRLQKSSRANRAHLRRFLLIGFYTGTRPGVIPKLLWEESATQAWVDLDEETIYRRGKREREHRTKKRPVVRIPPRLLAHMKRWRQMDQKASQQLAEASKLMGQKPPIPITSVLHHGGEPIAGRIRRGFASCVRDAGLPAEITPHWMRHTAATWLMEGGADIWAASAYLGMNPTTLENCYGHHRADHQSAARKAAGGRRA